MATVPHNLSMCTITCSSTRRKAEMRFETGAAPLSHIAAVRRHLHRLLSWAPELWKAHLRHYGHLPCRGLSCCQCSSLPVCLQAVPAAVGLCAWSLPLTLTGQARPVMQVCKSLPVWLTWRFPHPRVLQICHCIIPGLLLTITVIGCRLHLDALLPRLQSSVGLSHPQPHAASYESPPTTEV